MIMDSPDKYADIRPYRDDEVTPVLTRLLRDPELLAAMARLKLPRAERLAPRLTRVLLRWALRRELRGVSDVESLQKVLKRYMDDMIERTTSRFTVSGLENLPRTPCLLMSNHRDIALDPAFVNYARYQNGLDTCRIAIGDNLLDKPFAADLMRLNKSFIVPRSVRGHRQVVAAYRKLSGYIRDSLQKEGVTVWLAQREGRAKDGRDRTEVAIIKMLAMSMRKNEETFAEFVAGLNIVPVAISYEWDPCDAMKARELYITENEGTYQKAPYEDLSSIATGITGDKGHVHVAFGEPLRGDFETPEQVAAALDRQIHGDYVLHPSNLVACSSREPDSPWRELPCGFPPGSLRHVEEARAAFARRLEPVPQSHREWLEAIYANPARAQLALRETTAREA